MPWWTYLYIALLIISLPFGLMIMQKLQQDLLHPLGSLLSTLIGILFIFSYWLPEQVHFNSANLWIMLAFLLGWDFYSLRLAIYKLPQLLADMDQPPMEPAGLYLGMLAMLPTYIFAILVCLRDAW